MSYQRSEKSDKYSATIKRMDGRTGEGEGERERKRLGKDLQSIKKPTGGCMSASERSKNMAVESGVLPPL